MRTKIKVHTNKFFSVSIFKVFFFQLERKGPEFLCSKKHFTFFQSIDREDLNVPLSLTKL